MKRKAGIRATKVKRVTEYLLNQLLPLPCGSRLPGIRTIMEQTGAGRLTVSHALQEGHRRFPSSFRDCLRSAGAIFSIWHNLSGALFAAISRRLLKSDRH